jgi:ribosomal protein S9
VKIYLAGPMRGYANFNREAFAHWAGVLRAKGHEVFSPSENSLKLFGAAVRDNAGGDEGQMGGDQMTISRTVFAIDLAWICTQADAAGPHARLGREHGRERRGRCRAREAVPGKIGVA